MNKKVILVGVTLVAIAGVAWAGRAMYRARKNIVTINAYNTPLASVIKQIERQTREKIVVPKDLETKVTLDLKSVPLDEALDKLGRQAGLNWSKWYAVHDSSRGLDKLESALRDRTQIEKAGWTNIAPANLPGGPDWQAGGPIPGDNGMVVGRGKPLTIRLNGNDVKDGNVDAAVKEQLRAAGVDPSIIEQSGGGQGSSLGPGVNVPEGQVRRGMMMTRGNGAPQVRMFTRGRDKNGDMVQEIWSPEHVVLEERLQPKLGEKSYSEPTAAVAREIADKVKGDLTTIYVLSSAPGGFAFPGKMMRPIHVASGSEPGTNSTPGKMPPLPDIESAVRRAEAENYTRLTPEQRVQRIRKKQAGKNKLSINSHVTQ